MAPPRINIRPLPNLVVVQTIDMCLGALVLLIGLFRLMVAVDRGYLSDLTDAAMTTPTLTVAVMQSVVIIVVGGLLSGIGAFFSSARKRILPWALGTHGAVVAVGLWGPFLWPHTLPIFEVPPPAGLIIFYLGWLAALVAGIQTYRVWKHARLPALPAEFRGNGQFTPPLPPKVPPEMADRSTVDIAVFDGLLGFGILVVNSIVLMVRYSDWREYREIYVASEHSFSGGELVAHLLLYIVCAALISVTFTAHRRTRQTGLWAVAVNFGAFFILLLAICGPIFAGPFTTWGMTDRDMLFCLGYVLVPFLPLACGIRALRLLSPVSGQIAPQPKRPKEKESEFQVEPGWDQAPKAESLAPSKRPPMGKRPPNPR